MVITVGVLFAERFRILYFAISWPILIIVTGLFTFASRSASIAGHIQPYWAAGGTTPVAPPAQQDPQVKRMSQPRSYYSSAFTLGPLLNRRNRHAVSAEKFWRALRTANWLVVQPVAGRCC